MSSKIIRTDEDFRQAMRGLEPPFPVERDTQILGTRCPVGLRSAANRIVYQAMEGCDGTADGMPGELTVRRYRRYAESGCGIIWFEATAVVREGRANPRQLYLSKQNVDAFKALLDEIRALAVAKHGFAPLVIIQLTHSGRYSRPDGKPAPMIAKNNPLFETGGAIDASRIVTDEYLDALQDDYAESVRLARLAGFDGADLKSCHGYLLSELLSAYTRPGRYGGTLENRTRLLRSIVKNAAADSGDGFIVSTRINAYDGFPYPYGFGVKPGTDTEPDYSEIIRLVGELMGDGLQLLNVTMGNPYVNPHVNRPFASGGYTPPELPIRGVFRMLDGIRQIKAAHAALPVISSGVSYLGAMLPYVAAGCIRDGWFDFAGLGRLTFANPNAAAECVAGALNEKTLCLTCGKCSEVMRAGGTPGCVVYDKPYTEIYRNMKAEGKI